MGELAAKLTARSLEPGAVIAIDLSGDVATQRLVDVLMSLRGVPGISVQVVVPA